LAGGIQKGKAMSSSNQSNYYARLLFNDGGKVKSYSSAGR
jgi:hypothetical protein